MKIYCGFLAILFTFFAVLVAEAYFGKEVRAIVAFGLAALVATGFTIAFSINDLRKS